MMHQQYQQQQQCRGAAVDLMPATFSATTGIATVAMVMPTVINCSIEERAVSRNEGTGGIFAELDCRRRVEIVARWRGTVPGGAMRCHAVPYSAMRGETVIGTCRVSSIFEEMNR